MRTKEEWITIIGKFADHPGATVDMFMLELLLDIRETLISNRKPEPKE